jgi:hypothetical protein
MTATAPVPIPKGRPLDKPSRFDVKINAETLCHERVKEILKAPDTAKFDSTTAYPVTRTRYTVAGEVSAQNSFGALLQSGYSCTAIWRGTSKNGVIHMRVSATVR